MLYTFCTALLTALATAATDNQTQFKLNEPLLHGRLPKIQLSNGLLSVVDLMQLNAQGSQNVVRTSLEESPRPAAGTELCKAMSPTVDCCEKWYFESTFQYEECVSAAEGDNFVEDPFNIVDIANVGACMYHDRHALIACCRWIAKGVEDNVRRCVASRTNIMKRGLRVCVIAAEKPRRRCCMSMFRGRPQLYHLCRRRRPVFVDRRASCVYKDVTAQSRCCSKIFSARAGGNRRRAYDLCLSAVERLTSANKICYIEEEEQKEKCCKHECIDGEDDSEFCMEQDVPPCRIDSFERRVECCVGKFDRKDNDLKTCMVREFASCQLTDWKNRLACCASMYKAGSVDIKQCLYQFLQVVIHRNELTRLGACSAQHPPGSRFFEDCMMYAMKVCQLQSGDLEQVKKCCSEYFSVPSAGYSSCISDPSGSSYLTWLYGAQPDILPLSDPSNPSEDRVRYCEDTFTDNKWLKYACFIEITFVNLNLYHFTLYTGMTVPGYVQFTCAILDRVERESCCNSNYQGASTSFEVCMSWTPTAGLDFATRLPDSSQKSLDLQLTGAVAYAKSEPRQSTMGNATNKQLLLRFLGLMKTIEGIIHGPSPANLEGDEAYDSAEDEPDEDEDEANEEAAYRAPGESVINSLDDVPAEVLTAYKTFRRKVEDATKLQQSALFFHGASRMWMSCVSVVDEMSSISDIGSVYCARLSQAEGKEKIPQRNPVLEWECGAVDKVVRSTARLISWENAGIRQRYASRADSLEASELISERNDYGSEMTMIDLFADSTQCELANLRTVCCALCCDSYYAFSPMCLGDHDTCFG